MQPAAALQVRAVGWKAHAALAASGGAARVLAPLSASVYLTAGDQIVWLGGPASTLHPRAVLCAAPLAAGDGAVHLEVAAHAPWRPAPPAIRVTPAGMRSALQRLVHDPGALGRPDGLGALLAGATPPFPLDGAAPRAAALARACARDDASAAVEAAGALLGLGPGLTPSGDDFVGGAFFARALLARAGSCDGAAWRAAGGAVLSQARALTHPISLALLTDLVHGHGHAPLHDLAAALAAGAPEGETRDAARRLVAIGHSSGWDMLAGLAAGLAAAGR